LAVLNCRSIRGKTALFETFLDSENSDIIFGTESWLGPNISSSEVFPNHFQVFRRDRNLNGGGVFIAIKNTIPCFERTDLRQEDTEMLWCQATLDTQTLLLGSFYRTPDDPATPLESLADSLRKTMSSPGSPIIIVGGDFNVPGLVWTDDTVDCKDNIQKTLMSTINDHHLTQLVTFPTRRDANGTENTLDLLMTSHPSLISDVKPYAGMSDHCIVQACLTTKAKIPQKPSRKIPLWKSVDDQVFKDKVNELQQCYFERDPSNKSVEENWSFFRDTLNKVSSKQRSA
jgi:hypothetical protein